VATLRKYEATSHKLIVRRLCPYLLRSTKNHDDDNNNNNNTNNLIKNFNNNNNNNDLIKNFNNNDDLVQNLINKTI